jgi:hypothetical protein
MIVKVFFLLIIGLENKQEPIYHKNFKLELILKHIWFDYLEGKISLLHIFISFLQFLMF